VVVRRDDRGFARAIETTTAPWWMVPWPPRRAVDLPAAPVASARDQRSAAAVRDDGGGDA